MARAMRTLFAALGASLMGCSLIIGASWDGAPAGGTDAGFPDGAAADAAADASCDASTEPCDAGCCPRVKAIALAAGETHSCAVLEDSTVVCWGNNETAQLGLLPQHLTRSAAPVRVAGATGATRISAYRAHTCVTIGDTVVACWGSNTYGQLGAAPVSTAVATPVTTTYLGTTVDQVSAGGTHTCVVMGGGAFITCWGDNTHGQLGDGTQTASTCDFTSTCGVMVQGLGSPVATVVAGDATTCAIVGGALSCWGENNTGSLGNGSIDDSSMPVAVSLPPTVKAVAVGEYFTCALYGGTGACWGQSPSGALEFSNLPVSVDGLQGGTAAAGNGQACFIVAGGVSCWGPGQQPALDSPSPVSGLPSGIVAIAVGGAHVCALSSEGEVWCWGTNTDGQCGAPLSQGLVASPVRVAL
jgi:hypothetical protein